MAAGRPIDVDLDHTIILVTWILTAKRLTAVGGSVGSVNGRERLAQNSPELAGGD